MENAGEGLKHTGPARLAQELPKLNMLSVFRKQHAFSKNENSFDDQLRLSAQAYAQT
jgi:hypothetical protein